MNEVAQHLPRPSSEALDTILGNALPVLDKGFIRVIDYMGNEAAITQAARVSYGRGTTTRSGDRGLLRYLMRHWHTTPFEMCEIKLHVKLPIFVARQWIRHRTANVNEYSARYSILSREFYVPDVADIAKQSTTNKQGRADGTDDIRADEAREMMARAGDYAFDIYEMLSAADEPDDMGIARELSRIVTPVSTYTEWYWKVDLHNLLHFLRLRADPHAQKEIREYAARILDIVEVWVPTVHEAFMDYRMDAHTFSKQEMVILRKMVRPDFGGFVDDQDVAGLTDRELAAFRAVLNLGD